MKKQLIALTLTVSAFLGLPAAAKGVFVPKVDLKRCLVGSQAGLLKVLSPERKVLFTRGIDDRSLARMDENSRRSILSALNIEPEQYQTVADQLMKNLDLLPKKEAVAVLSTIAGTPDFANRTKVESFLVKTMQTSKDVYTRRQAILGLAVLPAVTTDTVSAVVKRYETCQNLWETFPIQQFFEYHAPQIKITNDYPQVRSRIEAVSSLYTPSVLAYLAP